MSEVMNEGQFEGMPAPEGTDGIVQTQWNLVLARQTADALAALADVDDIETRTWLGNLYLTYQQQASVSPGLDWAMAHTEVTIEDTAAGAYLRLGFLPVPYTTLMLETRGDYYVIQHDPDYSVNVEEKPLMELRLMPQADGLMIGEQHARDEMSDFVGKFLTAATMYYRLDQGESEVNPIFDMARVFLMYLGDQGYAPNRTWNIDELNADSVVVALHHREYDAGIEVLFSMKAVAEQYAHMVRLVTEEGQQNLAQSIVADEE